MREEASQGLAIRHAHHPAASGLDTFRSLRGISCRREIGILRRGTWLGGAMGGHPDPWGGRDMQSVQIER
ncbi:hypothetical protein HYQ46_011958 [Verticillium longisporum]|nr:hypothetical protein HYQ46_011958 [Verticillium longisporum]